MKLATSRRQAGALVVAHVAGMIDLVALPIWVSALMAAHGLNEQRVGALVTLYLAAVVLSCTAIAPRIERRGDRAELSGGFLLAAVAMGLLAHAQGFAMLAALHVLAGLSAGVGLSLTHRRMGLVGNPHRLFAMAGLALGVFSVGFLGAVPGLLLQQGQHWLFQVFALVMLVAAIATRVGLAAGADAAVVEATALQAPKPPLSATVRWLIAGIVCMTITQATLFSFVDRIGAARGFTPAQMQAIFIALGLVNLLPAPLAALLQHRLDARKVAMAGPVLQAALALVICGVTTYPPFAAAGAVFVAVMIFCHTFVFGLLAQLEPSGRATALTPAMLMSGSAVGPILGGTVAVAFGLSAIGYVTLLVGLVGAGCFWQARRRAATAQPAPDFKPVGFH